MRISLGQTSPGGPKPPKWPEVGCDGICAGQPEKTQDTAVWQGLWDRK